MRVSKASRSVVVMETYHQRGRIDRKCCMLEKVLLIALIAIYPAALVVIAIVALGRRVHFGRKSILVFTVSTVAPPIAWTVVPTTLLVERYGWSKVVAAGLSGVGALFYSALFFGIVGVGMHKDRHGILFYGCLALLWFIVPLIQWVLFMRSHFFSKSDRSGKSR